MPAPRPHIDFAQINERALEHFPSRLHDWFPQGHRRGREFCVGNLAGDRGQSLRIDLRTGRWIDFATGERGGDVVSLLAARDGIGQVEAAQRLADMLRVDLSVADEDSRKPHRLTINQEERRHEAVRIEIAARIWREAVHARDTIVETYLSGRGLKIQDGAELRFHPACPRGADRVPAMVALFTDIKTGERTGIHRTFLKADGSGKAEIEPAKMTLGRAGGSCIKLSPDEDVTDELGLSEGIENGLTALCAGWAPVWAAGSSGTLKAFPVLPGIEALTVFADPKPQEMVAARACADRWTAAGREVTIWEPHGGDWNDVMRGLGNEHDDGG